MRSLRRFARCRVWGVWGATNWCVPFVRVRYSFRSFFRPDWCRRRMTQTILVPFTKKIISMHPFFYAEQLFLFFLGPTHAGDACQNVFLTFTKTNHQPISFSYPPPFATGECKKHAYTAFKWPLWMIRNMTRVPLVDPHNKNRTVPHSKYLFYKKSLG